MKVYGLSRSRDKTGTVIKRNINPYVNCIHSQTGNARENMEVYVLEIISPKKVIGSTQKNAFIGNVNGVCPCITAAAGMGGGHVPMILYE